MTILSAEQALSDYLALGNGRSLVRLVDHYAMLGISGAPSLGSLKLWQWRDKWTRKAKEFDAKAGVRLAARTETAIVQKAFDRVSSLMKVAQRCLDTAGRIEIDESNATAADIKALTSAAIEAIKTVEVLTGGVSDRTEKVSGIADEAMALLRRLEDQKRKRIKAVDVDAVLVTDQSSRSDI